MRKGSMHASSSIPGGWLKPALTLPRLVVTTVDELLGAVAQTIAGASGIDAHRIIQSFREVLQSQGFSLGRGVAIPHADLGELTQTIVCLAVTERPLALPSLDHQPPDIFFFILARRDDPQFHLLLLAHVARLTQSKTLLDGLRQARTADEIMSLIQAAEIRHAPATAVTPLAAQPAATHALVMISIGGEKVVDALLVDLLGQGFDDACILEAQSLREAATREVPLFAGFRDIFGDPGGRRLLLFETPVDRVDEIISTLRKISGDLKAKDVRVSVVPVQTRWSLNAPASEEPPGSH